MPVVSLRDESLLALNTIHFPISLISLCLNTTHWNSPKVLLPLRLLALNTGRHCVHKPKRIVQVLEELVEVHPAVVVVPRVAYAAAKDPRQHSM